MLVALSITNANDDEPRGVAVTQAGAASAAIFTDWISLLTLPFPNKITGTAALTATAPVAPATVAFDFQCGGVSPAAIKPGFNTLLFSASAAPVPDIVALAATAQNDGILHITGTTGSNAFAVATVNVGASATITATANTGAANLPLAISLCQTDPTSGRCSASVGSRVSTTISANSTPTFGIFATGRGGVPFDPANNQLFVQFSDANGTVRGSTSVAVETQ